MSKKRRWLTNRRLFILEALLCVGTLGNLGRKRPGGAADIIDPLKVLIIMALVLGMFSAVTGLVEWHVCQPQKSANQQKASAAGNT